MAIYSGFSHSTWWIFPLLCDSSPEGMSVVFISLTSVSMNNVKNSVVLKFPLPMAFFRCLSVWEPVVFMKEGYCCFLLFTSYSHSCWYVIGVSSILLFNRGPTIVPLNAGYVKISHGIRYFLTSYIWLVNDGLWYWVFHLIVWYL